MKMVIVSLYIYIVIYFLFQLTSIFKMKKIIKPTLILKMKLMKIPNRNNFHKVIKVSQLIMILNMIFKMKTLKKAFSI